MVIQIFYTPDITIKPELPEEEAGHCIRVLRLGEGDEIVLTDGQGSFYKAAISRAHPKHCEVTLLESWKQPDLWNFNLHIAIAPAMKQSQKATLPALEGMTDFKKFVATPFDGRKFIAHCEEGEKPLLKHTYQPGENALILIGPEGDFSPEEIKLAQENGFEPISLGESRLRTETAALVACHTIHVLNQ